MINFYIDFSKNEYKCLEIIIKTTAKVINGNWKMR